MIFSLRRYRDLPESCAIRERGREMAFAYYMEVLGGTSQQCTYGRQARSPVRVDSDFKADVKERLAPMDSTIQGV